MALDGKCQRGMTNEHVYGSLQKWTRSKNNTFGYQAIAHRTISFRVAYRTLHVASGSLNAEASVFVFILSN